MNAVNLPQRVQPLQEPRRVVLKLLQMSPEPRSVEARPVVVQQKRSISARAVYLLILLAVLGWLLYSHTRTNPKSNALLSFPHQFKHQ